MPITRNFSTSITDCVHRKMKFYTKSKSSLRPLEITRGAYLKSIVRFPR